MNILESAVYIQTWTKEKKKSGGKGERETAGLTVKHSSLFDPPNLSFTPLIHTLLWGEKKKKEKKKNVELKNLQYICSGTEGGQNSCLHSWYHH